MPGATATLGLAFTAVATVSGTAEDGRPVLTGTMNLNWTTLATTGGCETEPPGTSTRDITLTPA